MTGLEHRKRTLVESFDQFVREIEQKTGNEYAVVKHIQRIRKIVNKAIASEWLDKDPFVGYEGKQ